MLTLNVQPFISACLDLHSVLGSRQTLLPMRDFMAAARAVESSLGPDHVPGLPERCRREIRAVFENAEKIEGMPSGNISLVFAVAVVEALRNLGLFPDADTLRKPLLVQDLFLRFIRDHDRDDRSPSDTLEGGALEVHEPARPTLHYLFDRMAEGALQAAVDEAPQAPVAIVDANAAPDRLPPLVDPGEGRLLVQGGLYLPQQGKIVASVNPSPYRIVREIAKGGNSVVYLGEERGTNRKVAVKIVTLKDESQRGELLARFEKEIEYQATFESERFVRVYATGMTAQGDPFIVMEHCERGSLWELIRADDEAGGFNLKRAVKIASQMVDAVALAHGKGIVHRDIKPHNYLVTADGDVKLGDCGLAEQADLLPTGATPHDVAGTPGYIPPETASEGYAGGKPGDVWALGVTLYELFTGVFCFPGADAVAMMNASVNKKPISPALLRPERRIPKVIDGIIMKCLEKERSRRYGDAAELLYDLLTADARALIEEAEEARRRVTLSRIDDKKHEEEWRDGLQEALRELRKVYDQFPHPKILRQRLDLNFSLHVWAKKKGDEETLRRTAESLAALAEAIEGEGRKEAASRLEETVHARFEEALHEIARKIGDVFERPGTDEELVERTRPIVRAFLDSVPKDIRDGTAARLDALIHLHVARRGQRFRLSVAGRDHPKLEIQIGRHHYRAKFLEFEKVVSRQTGLPREALRLERGIHSLRVSAPGCVPLNIPLPVRPGHYDVRIPLYRREEVPDPRAVVVPAGPAAARTQDGSFSELFEASSWRFTTHDVAFLPLRTNRDWLDYLQDLQKTHGTDHAVERAPKNWAYDDDRRRFVYADSGEDILWDVPVTHVLPAHAEEYLRDYLAPSFGPSFAGRIRHPKLNEWKRAMRGNTPGMWPWGDALPMAGAVCFSFSGHDNTRDRAVIPAPGSPLVDISPFSLPDVGRVLAHVVSNVQKFLDVSDDDDRRRIAAAFNTKDAERFFGLNVIVAGATYRSPATTNPDILNYRGRQETGDCGIMPVIQLNEGDATPTMDSLGQ